METGTTQRFTTAPSNHICRSMKTIALLIATCALQAAVCGCKSQRAATLHLSGDRYAFATPSTAVQITGRSGIIELPEAAADGFALRFSIAPDGLATPDTLLEIEDVINVRTRAVDNSSEWATVQNYISFPDTDGTIRVLEATITLTDSLTSDTPQTRDMTIGVPLSLLPKDAHDFAVTYTGGQFSLFADGVLLDNDFPIGTPHTRTVAARVSPTLTTAEISAPAPDAMRTPQGGRDIPQYWTPPYHNAWIGDVVACHYNGRYHLFYLLDRRGHRSKFGKGGHYFEHISTPDLINWTEHEAATPIEHQWETFGTGTPFEYDGKLYLSYGLHTTRLYPYERTTLPQMKKDFEMSGHTVPLDYDTITGNIPAGSSYAISDDGGITFRKTGKLFHYCENPSIYADSTGHLMMLSNYGAKGTWRSDSPDGAWTCIDPDFPPGGDCTFPFRVGNRDYVLGGFSGMWSKPAGEPTTEFTDMVREGKDCYNGLSVPAVTTLPDGRILMSGWLKIQNWGGALVTHEIIPDGADGSLGTRWVPELIPELPHVSPGRNPDYIATPPSYILEFTVTPYETGKGCVTVDFGNNTLWTLDLESDRAWFASSAADRPQTLGEGGDVSSAHDYAIPARTGVSTEIPVRIAVYSRPKFGGSIIDVELNRRRTMLSFRPGLLSKSISITGNGMRTIR